MNHLKNFKWRAASAAILPLMRRNHAEVWVNKSAQEIIPATVEAGMFSVIFKRSSQNTLIYSEKSASTYTTQLYGSYVLH